MGFPALKFFEGTNVGIGIIEIGDQANVHLMIFSVVHKCAPRGSTFSERPAQAVNDLTLFMFFRGDLPNFFYANGIMLGIFAFVQMKLTDQLLS